MNKNIRRIISFALAFGTITAMQPIRYTNSPAVNVYAESKVALKSLYLSDGELNFSQDERNYTVRVDSDVEDIRITAKPDCEKKDYDDYKVDIDGTEVTESDGFRTVVPLTKGENELKIRVENKDGKRKIYNLNIIRGRRDSDEAYGKNIYLKDIQLDYGDTEIDFDKDTTSYDVNVDEAMTEINIQARPEDSGDVVRINGAKVEKYTGSGDSDEKEKKGYKKSVKLEPGENKIEIDVTNDQDQKTYVLNITRGKFVSTQDKNQQETKKEDNTISSANSEKVETDNSSKQNIADVNKWVKVNGKWRYNDISGQPVKDTWFTDKNTNKTYLFDVNGDMVTGWTQKSGVWYYLGADGERKTGWQNISGKWYYLNPDGMMMTGWQQVNDEWYYLRNDGEMVTGWAKDLNGKYYYFYSSGKMAKNTVINGYKLGSDGEWIKN